MKICILSRYPPQLGGIAIHCQELTEELRKRGHEVTVITYGRFDRKKKGIEIYEIPIIDKFFLRGLSYFLGTLATLAWIRNRIDLIHCHPIHPAGTVATFFNLFHTVPVVITSHGSDLLKWSRIRFVDKFFSLIANSSDKLICVSRFIAREAKKIGIRKEKIAIVYNGIDIPTELKREDKNKLRKELGLPQKEKIILFVGALNEEKRPDILLRCAKNTDADFIFIGEGPLKWQLEERIKKYRLKNVKLLGSMEHEKTLKFIRAVDILAIPSKYEGFGIVALEGMLLGTAVIAKPVGALKEILPPESLANNLEKKLSKILENKRLEKHIIKKNKRIAEKFTVEKMVDEIEKNYQEVLVNKA